MKLCTWHIFWRKLWKLMAFVRKWQWIIMQTFSRQSSLLMYITYFRLSLCPYLEVSWEIEVCRPEWVKRSGRGSSHKCAECQTCHQSTATMVFLLPCCLSIYCCRLKWLSGYMTSSSKDHTIWSPVSQYNSWWHLFWPLLQFPHFLSCTM